MIGDNSVTVIKKNHILFPYLIFLTLFCISQDGHGQNTPAVSPLYSITLPEAHIGNLETDSKLLDSYGQMPDSIRQFYLDARSMFSASPHADFTNPEILKAAQKHHIALMGGPMLGKLSEDGVKLWMRPSSSAPLLVKVRSSDGREKLSYLKDAVEAGVEQRMALDGLRAHTEYSYEIYANKRKVAEGRFTTAPSFEEKHEFRVAFGSCFHKIGLHNTNLVSQILNREPDVMMLLGDIAVDDRENHFSMHRSDYLLRDLSKAWQRLAANVPIYATWDDHDYLNNDLSGIPEGFSKEDRKALRELWYRNWNNPENDTEAIYFNTHLGPVELIMLDTRSCRTMEERGHYASYLGMEQLNWLKKTLKNSTAPYKVISSGTMWSDYVSNGKDSWGTWDRLAREEIFTFIETENIPGVILISGDRHGARAFSLPRPSGYAFYEFEAASLGGVPGPDAMAGDPSHQLFGYHGSEVIAFGEFTFDTKGKTPLLSFRLIDESGNILEEHTLPYEQLTPQFLPPEP